ncbi:MAG: hypothetical protein COU63_02545 [Candidatus Pacebacteria bacterium CG10_big_fil_rev_8_21_14_0_10_36_11]|nr:HAD hydrolase-like protein [Candidatus Pacearchaeota archaeon]OIP74310.1 MAG: hypothetical protein AUK08_00800 [Candidatus Pacebacteria bacterium CG2_30_36_39]PIR64873.1 MAG: hypothetical protein COU63_02545 [Candidatus Pacebacteria bacterium CG10_big_fil_rev_8_21_14_0_10_36_11]PJC43115.1 MAG: hypothetical protein CO040_00855 [Candidatus Pacebacteria bacterium CG_4_9_14_0_2_um_filter_36_8]
MAPLILFDIDDTIINTQLLKRLQVKTMALATDSPIAQIEKFRLEYLNNLESGSDFSTDDYLQKLGKKFQVPFVELKEAFWHPRNFELCLFPEVRDVLATLRHEKYSLGLFSEGYQDFQEHKLRVNGLLEFFDSNQRHILRRKLNPTVIESLPKGTIIIDDKQSVIEYLEQFPHIVALRIVRDPQQAKELLTSRYTLLDLRELIPLLGNINYS